MLDEASKKLFHAVERDDAKEIVRLIMNRSIANINIRLPVSAGLNELTPLLYACYKGRMNAAIVLLENGADRLMRSTTYNVCPHDMASQYGHHDLSKKVEGWDPSSSYLTSKLLDEIRSEEEIQRRINNNEKAIQEIIKSKCTDDKILEMFNLLVMLDAKRSQSLKDKQQRYYLNDGAIGVAVMFLGILLFIQDSEKFGKLQISGIVFCTIGVLLVTNSTIRKTGKFSESMHMFFEKIGNGIEHRGMHFVNVEIAPQLRTFLERGAIAPELRAIFERGAIAPELRNFLERGAVGPELRNIFEHGAIGPQLRTFMERGAIGPELRSFIEREAIAPRLRSLLEPKAFNLEGTGIKLF